MGEYSCLQENVDAIDTDGTNKQFAKNKCATVGQVASHGLSLKLKVDVGHKPIKYPSGLTKTELHREAPGSAITISDNATFRETFAISSFITSTMFVLEGIAESNSL